MFLSPLWALRISVFAQGPAQEKGEALSSGQLMFSPKSRT